MASVGAGAWALLVLVGTLNGCVTPPHDRNPSHSTDDAPTVTDTDVVGAADTDEGVLPAQDTDSPPDPVPHLVWTELISDIFAARGCNASWFGDLAGDGSTRATYYHPFAGGRHVAGADDPWYTLLVDAMCDVDHDGTAEQRGLVLAYDPATGTVVDQPNLPDDFVSLGLILPTQLHRQLHGLMVVDLDDDGQSEVLKDIRNSSGTEPPDYFLRYDADQGRLVALPDFAANAPDGALSSGPTSFGLSDVDNDGLIDVEWLGRVDGRPAEFGPMSTLVQAGDDTWQFQALYEPCAVRNVGSGVGTLWQKPGGLQIRITPGDELGHCQAQKHDVSGDPVLNSDGYPTFAACDIGAAALDTPMGMATADLNGDGNPELLVSTDNEAVFSILAYQDFFDAQPYNVSQLYAAERPDAIDVARHIIPWAVEGVDIDSDGHVDIVAASGEDAVDHSDPAACALQATCIGRQPVGVWWNPGVPGPGGFPDLAYVGLDHILGNKPPIMNANGTVFDDVDEDGDVDFLFSPVTDGEPLLYRNDTELGHRFCLRGHGNTSNALGVGSFVEVETSDGHIQHFQVGGSSGPNVQTGTPQVCVGLGEHTHATVRWTWPSGYIQTVENVPAGGAHLIEEPAIFSVLSPAGDVVPASVSRRNPNGASVRLLLCAYSDAPVQFGDAPQRLTSTPIVEVTKVSFGAGSHSFYATSGPPPQGCVEYGAFAYSSRPTSTVYSVVINGTPLRVHPRLWWGD